jgi:hypothetical protein
MNSFSTFATVLWAKILACHKTFLKVSKRFEKININFKFFIIILIFEREKNLSRHIRLPATLKQNAHKTAQNCLD